MASGHCPTPAIHGAVSNPTRGGTPTSSPTTHPWPMASGHCPTPARWERGEPQGRRAEPQGQGAKSWATRAKSWATGARSEGLSHTGEELSRRSEGRVGEAAMTRGGGAQAGCAWPVQRRWRPQVASRARSRAARDESEGYRDSAQYRASNQ